MPIESEIKVFEDRIVSGQWRVEYFDDDGGCYVAIFAGPAAEQRARDYRDALGARLLAPVSVIRAPWKGGAFQWVQIPPGNRSSRKQPEQSWR